MCMNDNKNTGFDLPKPDVGIGKVHIGGDAKPVPDDKKDPIDDQWKHVSSNWDSSFNDD